MTDPAAGFRALEATPQIADLRNRHRDFYRSLVAESSEADGEEQVWIDLLEADLDNLRAAIVWSLDSRDAEAALELATGCGRLWEHGRYSEGRQWFGRALTLEGATPRCRAIALIALAHLEMMGGDNRAGAARADEALDLARGLGDDSVLGGALMCAASARRGLSDFQTATRLAAEGVEVTRRTGRPGRLAAALRTSAHIALFSDGPALALDFARQALEVIEGGPAEAVIAALRDVGELLWASEELDLAAAQFERAAALRTHTSHPERVVYELSSLAGIADQRGDLARAAELCRQVRSMAADFEDKGYLTRALRGLASIERAQGAPPDVVRGYLLEVISAVEGQALEPGLGAHWNYVDALEDLADLAELEGDHASARRYLEKRAQVGRSHFHFRAHSFDRLSGLAALLGDKEGAKRYAAARLEELNRISAPPPQIAHARATVASIEGDMEKAYSEITAQLAPADRSEWHRKAEGFRNVLSAFALRAGDLEVARNAAELWLDDLARQSLPKARGLVRIAEVELAAGNGAAAATALREALGGAHLLHTVIERITLVEALGRAMVAIGEDERGAELLGVARGECDRLQYVRSQQIATALEATAADARSRLGDDVFGAAFERGRRTPIAEAISRESQESET